MPRKKNYLNNRDILTQIHLSKISYCSFKDKEKDCDQDIIVDDVSEINESLLLEGRKERAKRLSHNLPKKEKIDYKDISNQDVVIRVMTEEHIPLVPKKKVQKNESVGFFNNIADDLDIDYEHQSSQNEEDDEDTILVPMKTNFHPFFHYRVDENNTPFLIGKSHWKGNLEDGKFCQTHGSTTDELAKMYMKLCDRYGTRSNWRNYTYNDEMRGAALMQLIQVGLKFNEAKSDNPFAYYTAIVTNSFTRVLLNEKKMQNIRDDILEENGLAPSWTRQQATKDEKENKRSAQMYKDNKQRAIEHAREETE